MGPRKPPKLSDPGGSPRFPKRGEVKREKPIFERHAFGPWGCDVTVIPLTGLRRGYALYEVNCRWENGPPLDPAGGGPQRGFSAVDQYVVDREAPDLQLTNTEAFELALELARRAADLLSEGVQPNLNDLVQALLRRLKW